MAILSREGSFAMTKDKLSKIFLELSSRRKGHLQNFKLVSKQTETLTTLVKSEQRCRELLCIVCQKSGKLFSNVLLGLYSHSPAIKHLFLP